MTPFASGPPLLKPLRLPIALSLLTGLAAAGPVAAQSQSTAKGTVDAAETQLAAPVSARATRGVRVEQEPDMDGNVLDDPAWAAATPSTGFRQTAPDEGLPATQRTEVRIVFTDDTIYFGVVCYDDDPSAIIVSDSRRDSSMNDADSFQMVLDTFTDQQNGFVFGTTPAGQEYDGQVINEGGERLFGGSGGGGFSRGGGGGFNINWDGAWQVSTAITEIGWSAEFAIPFRTIRFPDRAEQTWGVNFQRNIRRRNETAYWAPLPRQYNLYRVSMAGQLTDIMAPVGISRNLQFTPYVTGELLTRDNAPDADPLALRDFGADLKYSVTSGLTLDATYNTDFAQVEVDQQQVNLDRFNLFFPEKRPFFLENAGAFTVNNAGPASGMNLGQTELFFSRRIGISDAGNPIPILGGARLSGKVGDSTTVGFINMQTETVTAVTPANNFTVARVRQDLPQSIESRRALRQPPVHRAGGARQRLQPDVCRRRPLGRRTERPRAGLRRTDPDARARRPRPCPERLGDLQLAVVADHQRLSGERRGLQSRGRVPPPDRFPEVRPRHQQHEPTGRRPAIPGAHTAHELHAVLELRRRALQRRARDVPAPPALHGRVSR